MKKRLIHTAILAACTTFAIPGAIAQTGADRSSPPPTQESPGQSGTMGQSQGSAGQSGTMSRDQGAASSAGQQSDRMAAGRPSFDQLIRGSSLIGYDVVSSDGEQIGEVEDVAIGADGSIQYVVVEMGGFLDIGDTHTIVRWDELTASPDRIQVNVSKNELEQEWRNINLSDEDEGKLGFKAKEATPAG